MPAATNGAVQMRSGRRPDQERCEGSVCFGKKIKNKVVSAEWLCQKEVSDDKLGFHTQNLGTYLEAVH